MVPRSLYSDQPAPNRYPRTTHSNRIGRVERTHDLVVGHEQLTERAFLLPRSHRVALHHPVRVVAAASALDEREEHRLAEHEPERRIEVAQHPLRIDAQSPRETRHLFG